MKRMLLVPMLCAVSFAVLAQDAKPASPPKTEAGVGEKAMFNDRSCLRFTGSRIAAASNARRQAAATQERGKRDCAPVSGRSYSRDDLDSTGQTNVGDALRTLDPSVNY